MPTGLQVWAVSAIVAIIWLALLVVAGLSGNLDQFSKITSIVPALVLGAVLFERYGWRWAPLHPHFVHMPIVRGTWEGELGSLWTDQATQSSPSKKTTYLTIEQTLTTISVRLHSDESSSEQIAGTVATNRSGQRIIASTYVNIPRVGQRERSRPHYGGVILTVFGDPPTRLEGEYWTDRQSKGGLVFRGHSPEIADSYETAKSLSFRRTSR
jgi:hypothetical protein